MFSFFCFFRNENISCVAVFFFLIYLYASSLVVWDAAEMIDGGGRAGGWQCYSKRATAAGAVALRGQ